MSLFKINILIFYISHVFRIRIFRKGVEECVRKPRLPTTLLTLMHAKHTIPQYTCMCNRLPEEEPLVSIYGENINKLKISILI